MPNFAHTLLACGTTTSKDPRSSRDPQVPGGPPGVKTPGCLSVSHTFALLISPQPFPPSMPTFAHTLLTCQTTTSKDPRSSRDPQVPGGPPDVKNDQMCKNDQMTTPTGLLTGNSRGPPTPGAPERMQKWWRPQWRTPSTAAHIKCRNSG